LTIVRAHEVFPEGYQRRSWNEKLKNVPSVITIFSAPNYCGIYGNKAAILRIKVINNSYCLGRQ
jgi:serine/threonine-protein phosphatase 2B catalytic subunit